MKVYEFSSAQDFIQSAFSSSRSGNNAMTVEKYAKQIGIGKSTLKMILCGKRKPTVHQVLSIARALRLSLKDTSYLETLTLRESAQSTWEKTYYSKILAAKKREVKVSTISISEKKLLSSPMVLPLLVYIMENKTTEIDYAKLSKKLQLSQESIKELVSHFQKNEMLMKQPDGAFHVAFDKLNHRLLQKNYLKKWLTEAANKMDSEYDKAESLFVGYTFGATNESLHELQMEIKGLMEKYMAMEIEGDGSKAIAQACFQVFPVIRGDL